MSGAAMNGAVLCKTCWPLSKVHLDYDAQQAQDHAVEHDCLHGLTGPHDQTAAKTSLGAGKS